MCLCLCVSKWFHCEMCFDWLTLQLGFLHMALSGDFLIFRLCENQHGVQCLLGVHGPLSTVFLKDTLHCISYDNTEDRNTIFKVTCLYFTNLQLIEKLVTRGVLHFVGRVRWN